MIPEQFRNPRSLTSAGGSPAKGEQCEGREKMEQTCDTCAYLGPDGWCNRPVDDAPCIAFGYRFWRRGVPNDRTTD